MSTYRRLITGGAILLGAAALWHAGATAGHTSATAQHWLVVSESNPTTAAVATSRDRAARSRQSERADRGESVEDRLGVIDERLIEQHREGRLQTRSSRVFRAPTEEMTGVILEIAEQIDPEMAAELRHVCDDDPREFARIVHTSGRHLISLAELKANDPEMYNSKVRELKNEAQIARKADQMRLAYLEGDMEQVNVLREDLRPLVVHRVAFSIRSRVQLVIRLEEHVEQLQERIKQLREELDHIATNFDRVTQNELDSVIRAAQVEAEFESAR